jgi:hypothetical protein
MVALPKSIKKDLLALHDCQPLHTNTAVQVTNLGTQERGFLSHCQSPGQRRRIHQFWRCPGFKKHRLVKEAALVHMAELDAELLRV